jgi:hypothetical protein
MFDGMLCASRRLAGLGILAMKPAWKENRCPQPVQRQTLVCLAFELLGRFRTEPYLLASDAPMVRR